MLTLYQKRAFHTTHNSTYRHGRETEVYETLREQNGGLEPVGKFLTLLTLERSSFRENATLQATFFTRSICQDLNEPLNVPQTRKRPKKERTNKLSLTAQHYTPAAHARARGNEDDRKFTHTDRYLHFSPTTRFVSRGV